MSVGYTWLTDAPPTAKHNWRHWFRAACLLAGVVFVISPMLYMHLMDVMKGDHKHHVTLVQRGVETGIWPVHFLYPTTVYALSGFRTDFDSLAKSALVVLTLCVFAKALLTYWVLVRSCAPSAGEFSKRTRLVSQETILMLVAMILLVMTPIMRPWAANRIYLGQISPNVWHNPTCLICWPLAILLFFAGYEFLRTAQLRILAVVGVLSMLSVMAKPNYFLAFAPAFAMAAWWRFGLSRHWIFSQLAMAPTVALLYWQLTASFDGVDAMRPGRTIGFRPLESWQVFSDSVPLSLLFSLAFPLTYLAVFRRTLSHGWLMAFGWMVMLCALMWTTCFAEVYTATGKIDTDFNFSWGSHLAIYILFVVTAIDMCSNPAAIQAFGWPSLRYWKAQLPWYMFTAHVVSGVIYLGRQFSGKGFV